MFNIVVIVNKKYNYSISYHFIIGSISLLRLKKLERLDLGSNGFKRSIIPSLRLLKSLKTLSLAGNSLEGSFPAKGMPIYHNTYKVYKQFLLFTFFFFHFLVELSVFEDLEMLDLSINEFNGSLTVQGREIEKIIFWFTQSY